MLTCFKSQTSVSSSTSCSLQLCNSACTNKDTLSRAVVLYCTAHASYLVSGAQYKRTAIACMHDNTLNDALTAFCKFLQGNACVVCAVRM
jgi:hypothetical protein